MHFTLPMSYYYEAIRHMDQHYGEDNVVYIVFSNDGTYAEEQFAFLGSRRGLVDKDIADYLQFLLMTSLNGGAIIANSTFSWWGAYLMDSNKVLPIIAPRVWYSDGVDQTGRRLLPHWIAM